ncbi:MAG: coat protein [Clostridia bacterium]|nr:coat protein [Clostridia bacterium]
MANLIQNIAGMGEMTEQIIATDFLLDVKNGIKNYAAALSETATPEVRNVLKKHLDAAIFTHEKIIAYMMDKGYYHAYNLQEQIKIDLEASNTVMELKI